MRAVVLAAGLLAAAPQRARRIPRHLRRRLLRRIGRGESAGGSAGRRSGVFWFAVIPLTCAGAPHEELAS
jgi:hypothetical protein